MNYSLRLKARDDNAGNGEGEGDSVAAASECHAQTNEDTEWPVPSASAAIQPMPSIKAGRGSPPRVGVQAVENPANVCDGCKP